MAIWIHSSLSRNGASSNQFGSVIGPAIYFAVAAVANIAGRSGTMRIIEYTSSCWRGFSRLSWDRCLLWVRIDFGVQQQHWVVRQVWGILHDLVAIPMKARALSMFLQMMTLWCLLVPLEFCAFVRLTSLNSLLQPFKPHTYGFSPVCIRRWFLRVCLWVNSFGQISQRKGIVFRSTVMYIG